MARKAAAAQKQLRITLVRGLAGKRDTHITTVRALGLRKPHQTVERPDTPDIRGQIDKVSYLLKVEEL